MYQSALKDTIYFIGVTTEKSSIMRVFPKWASYLGLGDVVIKGMNFVPHDEPEAYREAVRFIKNDERSRGALVTTHKVDLLHACHDLFDELDRYALLLNEVSSISKREGKLIGHAKDPLTSGLALNAFLPQNHWKDTGAEAFIMGAGGSAAALTWHLMQGESEMNRPSRIVVSNRSVGRFEEMRKLHHQLDAEAVVEYLAAPLPADNDKILSGRPPHSLIVNATGLGKDAPGSPLTEEAIFPEDGFVWDFNYRGDLLFLEQARAQSAGRGLHIEDGWIYFLHGWTQVIAEVFHTEIPSHGPIFDELSKIAATTRT